MDSNDQNQPEKDITVTLHDYSFDPPVINITQGTRVNWINKEGVEHTVVSDPDGSLFQSGELHKDEIYSYTFENAGEYDYHCSIHPTMKGKVIVEGS